MREGFFTKFAALAHGVPWHPRHSKDDTPVLWPRRDETSETRERLSHKTCNAIDENRIPELKDFASYLSYLTNICITGLTRV